MMIKINKKSGEIFSIRETKENPFNSLNKIFIHKNKNLLKLKERKQEWENEYYLIYNSENND